ncbi:hypothetical protein BJV78DRAFT_1230186, partial [Lactifluus subvellereus]
MTGNPIVLKTTWSQYLSQMYTIGQPPVIGLYDYCVVELSKRRHKLTKDNHGTTYCGNLDTLEQWRIIPVYFAMLPIITLTYLAPLALTPRA